MEATTSQKNESAAALVGELIKRWDAVEQALAERATCGAVLHCVRMLRAMRGPVTALHDMLSTRDDEMAVIKANFDRERDEAVREAYERGLRARGRTGSAPQLTAV